MWYYKDKKFQLEDYPNDSLVGFVYQITEKDTNKKYIGKKLFWSSRKKKVKGRNRRVVLESNWKDYYGSNRKIQELVEEKGFKRFHREILKLCKSKGECSYWESKLQFDNHVLLRDDYYNEIIHCRINSKHLSKESILWQLQKTNPLEN
tara:strand:- start:2080 stop:2526 length:447 start_codon:yes stop_codon:yes gene_type:complete